MSETAVATAPPPSAAPPAETPAAPPTTERAPADFMADIIGDLGAMDEGKPAPSIPRDDKGKFVKSTDKPKPAEKPVETPVDKPTEAPADKPVETPQAEVKPVKAAELRTAYEGLKKRVREELEPEVQKLRAKVKEFETQSPEAASPLLDKIKALEGRNSQLEQHMAYVDYTQSRDFLTKYQEPYRQAWQDAVTEFRELTVREQTGEDEMGEPVFKTRPADENDLLRLANMKLSEMDEAATKMFGASAARAINHIQNVKKLSGAQARAVEEARTKAKEFQTQRAAEFQQRAKQLADTWQDINKSLQEKFPKAFAPEEGNAEDKTSHTKGFALADLLFLGPEALTPEQLDALPKGFQDTLRAKKPLSETQRVQLHALARLKMANHDRQIVRLKAAQLRIKELEKELAEYEQSSPSAERAASGERAGRPLSPEEQIEQELRALDK